MSLAITAINVRLPRTQTPYDEPVIISPWPGTTASIFAGRSTTARPAST